MSTAAILQELEQESTTTRRVLERVPADKLGWKPHPKSMSLGQLAMHVASVPGFICEWATADVRQLAGNFGPPQPASRDEILAAHAASLEKSKAALASIGDVGLDRMWQLNTHDGQSVMAMPKGALIRSVGMNHVYHHRGQLSVYLRLLDVPVPSIYGPSADDNPFAART
jgi:uncharacterized damage-inducible protein DinB